MCIQHPQNTRFHPFSFVYIIETHNFDSTMNKNITNRVSQSLDSYLIEVNKHPLQTVEEQNGIWNTCNLGQIEIEDMWFETVAD